MALTPLGTPLNLVSRPALELIAVSRRLSETCRVTTGKLQRRQRHADGRLLSPSSLLRAFLYIRTAIH
jgi:hypothetical protein